MDSDNLFTECPGCGTTDAPVRTEETANAVAFQCQQCGVVWITDRHGEPEILPPKPTVDSDLRTKLEALLNRLIETYEAHEQWAREDNNFGERLLAMNIVGDLTHIRALLADTGGLFAADG